jgi:hypothetical protein
MNAILGLDMMNMVGSVLFEPDPTLKCNRCLDSRGPGYKSPRRSSYHNPPSRRAPPDPHTLDYPASLKQYAEWFRYYYPQAAAEEDSSDKAAQQQAADGSKPRNGIKLRWEKYKKSFSAQQVHRFSFVPPKWSLTSYIAIVTNNV